MPSDFVYVPGNLGHDAEVDARGLHDVTLTGTCAILASMVPRAALSAPQAVGDPTTLVRMPLRQFYFALVGALRPGATFPPNHLLVAGIIHPRRLGMAFEACVKAGLDITPTTLSVARVRLLRMAKTAYLGDPAPFMVLSEDIYRTRMALRVPAPLAAVGGAIPGAPEPNDNASPAYAGLIQTLWFTGSDGTFAPLGFAEAIRSPPG